MSTVLTNKEVVEYLAINVAKRLQELGWSQSKLAAESGENAMMISRIINQEVIPSSPAVARIAEALGVSVDFLLREPVAEKKSRRHA